MIRDKIKNQNIFFVVDETTDACGRYIANFVVGILNATEASGTTYLVNVAVLDKTNHTTVARFVNDTLNLLYLPNKVPIEKVKLMLSDAAAYMIKAGHSLKVFFPHLVHFTGMAHALHRLAEFIRSEYCLVNKLINNGKKVFLKAPLRVQRYREAGP
jgi:hypothetical protein